MQQTYLHSTNAIHPVPLSTYLLLTFGSAWLVWSPLLLAEYLHLTLPVPSLVFITLGTFAPSITALFLTWRYAGGTELRRLLRRAVIWRVSPVWYLIAIAGPALIMLLAMGVHVLLGGTIPDYVPFGVRWLIVVVNFILILLIGGPLGEEFGWRGLALPSLEARFSPLWASLILGVIWAVWHLPLFFISGSKQPAFWVVCPADNPSDHLDHMGLSWFRQQPVASHALPCRSQHLVWPLDDQP